MKKTILINLCLGSALFLAQGLVYANEPATAEDQAMTLSDASDKAKEVKHYLSDTEITAKVKEKFIEEKLFSKKDIAAMGIHVKTNKGVVTLTGTVHEQTQADNAVTIAKSIDGVKDVQSHIKVKAPK